MIGAALGSVVSTVLAALYTDWARTARDKIPKPTLLAGQVGAPVRPPHKQTGQSTADSTPTPTLDLTQEHSLELSPYVATVGVAKVTRVRRLRRMLAATGVVFALAVVGLTALELGLGHPVSSGEEHGGTSIGNVVGTRPQPAPDSSTTTSPPSTSPTSGETSTTANEPSPSSPGQTSDPEGDGQQPDVTLDPTPNSTPAPEQPTPEAGQSAAQPTD